MKTKNFINGLVLLITIGFIQSCSDKGQKTGNYQDDLSAEQKTAITNEILDLTTNWVNANDSMSADKAIQLWDSTSDLRFAENGEFFANRDSIYSFLKGFYSNTTSMEIRWLDREVIPLSMNAATMSGSFHFKAMFRGDGSHEDTVMYTGVFVRKDNKWVLINGHESYR
jgi:hypothetical protein